MTLDNENFKYVDITGIENPIVLKERIFSRMKILAEKNKYGVFETTELGDRKSMNRSFQVTSSKVRTM